MSVKADYLMDVKGLYCPEPIMLLHKKMREMTEGEVVEILATDPSTQRDIPKFCSFLGHKLIEQEQVKDVFRFYICKG